MENERCAVFRIICSGDNGKSSLNNQLLFSNIDPEFMKCVDMHNSLFVSLLIPVLSESSLAYKNSQ